MWCWGLPMAPSHQVFRIKLMHLIKCPMSLKRPTCSVRTAAPPAGHEVFCSGGISDEVNRAVKTRTNRTPSEATKEVGEGSQVHAATEKHTQEVHREGTTHNQGMPRTGTGQAQREHTGVKTPSQVNVLGNEQAD